MKYRYTEEVEAFQYDGDFMNKNGKYYVPYWAVYALKYNKLGYINESSPWELYLTNDLYAEVVNVGDYLVKLANNDIICITAEDFTERFKEVGN